MTMDTKTTTTIMRTLVTTTPATVTRMRRKILAKHF